MIRFTSTSSATTPQENMSLTLVATYILLRHYLHHLHHHRGHLHCH